MIIDDIRARYPALGLALYAMEPGQPVTLESYTPDGRVWSFTAPTAAEAIARAFPDLVEPAPAPDPKPSLSPETTMRVVASLAAAISLLERSPKKAAASNKMFDQMLRDYRAALDVARDELRQEPADEPAPAESVFD